MIVLWMNTKPFKLARHGVVLPREGNIDNIYYSCSGRNDMAKSLPTASSSLVMFGTIATADSTLHALR